MPLINECQFRAVGGGLGDFVVASAITGFFTPEQCTTPAVVDGGIYHWRAESDDFTQHESFEGAYDSATDTVARTTIFQSSNGGAKVNFSAAPRVRQVAIRQDLRELLRADRTYYVDSGLGSDLNGGLTPGTAFATIQHAVNVITGTLDLNVFDVTISVADGTYTETIKAGAYVGAPPRGYVEIVGNTTTWSNVIINGSPSFYMFYTLGAGANYYIHGFKIDSGNAGFYMLFASSRSLLFFGEIEFVGGFNCVNIGLEQQGVVGINGDVKISSDMYSHVSCYSQGAYFGGSAFTIDITTPVTTGVGFVEALEEGYVDISNQTFVNFANVSGPKFSIAQLGSLRTGTNDVDYLPGTVAGTIGPGSYYTEIQGPVGSSTFASVPSVGAGTFWRITDSNTSTWGATIAGGGANNVLAWYNGTNWTVIGV